MTFRRRADLQLALWAARGQATLRIDVWTLSSRESTLSDATVDSETIQTIEADGVRGYDAGTNPGPQVASARRHAWCGLRTGRVSHARARLRCDQTIVEIGPQATDSSASDLEGRRFKIDCGMSPHDLLLAVDRCAASGQRDRFCRLAHASDCGTNISLSGRYRRLNKGSKANPRNNETWTYFAMIYRMAGVLLTECRSIGRLPKTSLYDVDVRSRCSGTHLPLTSCATASTASCISLLNLVTQSSSIGSDKSRTLKSVADRCRNSHLAKRRTKQHHEFRRLPSNIWGSQTDPH